MANEYRITHAHEEVLRKGDPDTRITHAHEEVLRKGDPDTRITHAVAEILREYIPCNWLIEDVELRFFT